MIKFKPKDVEGHIEIVREISDRQSIHVGWIRKHNGEWIFQPNMLPQYLSINDQKIILSKCREFAWTEEMSKT